jgi:N-acetylmuramoyl-L-alanine amidase
VIDKLIKEQLTPRGIVLDQEVVDVLAYTSRPAVLLELGFVTNEKEYNYLKTAAAQEEIAERLFLAFAAYKPVYDSYFNIDFSTQPVPELPEEPQEPAAAEGNAYFGIQVMAGSRELKAGDPAFKGFDAHWVKSDNGIYKYIIGKHVSKAEAQDALAKVRASFPDAFIVKVTGNAVTRP